MRFASHLFIALFALGVIEGATAQPLPRGEYLVQVGVADSVYSDVLGEQRQFWVHLPNEGDLQEGHRYPVIYLLDGGVHLGGLAAIQAYYDHFRLPEMIVVGISNRIHRTRDLTPSAVETRQGLMAEASGGAEAFTRFLAEELIPTIDRAYPTSGHRTLIGHSYAGLFTIHTLVRHRDLFRNYVAIDPSLDWDDQALLHEATAALAEGDFSGTGLYVSLANEILRFSDTMTVEEVVRDTTDFSLGIRSILAFTEAAEAHPDDGLRFSWVFYEQDIHGSVPLVSMRDGLVFLYDWWELKHPALYNDPSTPTAEIVGLIRDRTAALTEGMGEPTAMQDDLLTMLGFMALEGDQPEKARAVFELLVEYYPENADAHSALAEGFEAEGDRERALHHARMAFSLSGSEEHATQVEALTGPR